MRTRAKNESEPMIYQGNRRNVNETKQNGLGIMKLIRTFCSKVAWVRSQSFSHPPYSFNLSSADYYTFKHLNHFLNNEIFQNFPGARNKKFFPEKPLGFLRCNLRKQNCLSFGNQWEDSYETLSLPPIL